MMKKTIYISIFLVLILAILLTNFSPTQTTSFIIVNPPPEQSHKTSFIVVNPPPEVIVKTAFYVVNPPPESKRKS